MQLEQKKSENDHAKEMKEWESKRLLIHAASEAKQREVIVKETLHPKSCTRNPELQTLTPKPKIVVLVRRKNAILLLSSEDIHRELHPPNSVNYL